MNNNIENSLSKHTNNIFKNTQFSLKITHTHTHHIQQQQNFSKIKNNKKALFYQVNI